MRKFVLFIFLFVALGLYAGGHTTVIVSLDGFRWDYPQMYDTPFLDMLGRQGVRAVMRPSFPASSPTITASSPTASMTWLRAAPSASATR